MAQMDDIESVNAFLISSFYLGDTLFGLDTFRVQEAIKVIDITTVPHAQEYVMGVINLRGKIVTILNLARKLGLHSSEITDESRIIIVSWDDEFVGLLVDQVSDVIPADRGDIKPSPSNVKGAQGKYFEGIYHIDQRLIVILNVDTVLID